MPKKKEVPNEPSDCENKKAKTTHAALTWRRDPKESFSDWKIIVNSKSAKGDGSDSPQTYHIHKAIVGAGPRGSHYFGRLFHSDHLKESESSTSRTELEESSMKAFPIMLDFIYGDKDVEATGETAVALRHLASYFDVPTLFENVNNFIMNNIDEDNILVYSQEAQLYQDDGVIEAVARVAAYRWVDVIQASPSHSLEKNLEEPTNVQMLPESKQMEVMQHGFLLFARRRFFLLAEITSRRN